MGITQHQYAIILSLKCGFRLLLEEVMLDSVEVVISKTLLHWNEGDYLY